MKWTIPNEYVQKRRQEQKRFFPVIASDKV